MAYKSVLSKRFSQKRGTQRVARDSEIGPCRSRARGQQHRIARAQPRFCKTLREAPMQRFEAIRCAVENHDRQARGDGFPRFPAMKPGEVIRPHQPDKTVARVLRLQEANRVDAVVKPVHCFDIHHPDARVARDRPCTSKPRRIFCEFTCFLERVLRRDEPPDFIEPKALHRLKRNMQMAFVRRVERTAEQADAAAVIRDS